MSEKLQIPHWLNDDAILGVVVHCGVLYFVTGIDWIGTGDRALCLTRHKSEHIDAGWFRLDRCKLRRDLWPVKPELDELFEKAPLSPSANPPTDEEYQEAWESAAGEKHF